MPPTTTLLATTALLDLGESAVRPDKRSYTYKLPKLTAPRRVTEEMSRGGTPLFQSTP